MLDSMCLHGLQKSCELRRRRRCRQTTRSAERSRRREHGSAMNGRRLRTPLANNLHVLVNSTPTLKEESETTRRFRQTSIDFWTPSTLASSVNTNMNAIQPLRAIKTCESQLAAPPSGLLFDKATAAVLHSPQHPARQRRYTARMILQTCGAAQLLNLKGIRVLYVGRAHLR